MKDFWPLFGILLLVVCAIGAAHDEYKAGHYTQEYIQRQQRWESKQKQKADDCFNPQGLGCGIVMNPILTPEQQGLKP